MPATWNPMTMDATATQARRVRRSQRPRKVVDGGEGRALIPPTPRPCSLAPSLTTPLYSTAVSQALRQPLGGGVVCELPRIPIPRTPVNKAKRNYGSLTHGEFTPGVGLLAHPQQRTPPGGWLRSRWLSARQLLAGLGSDPRCPQDAPAASSRLCCPHLVPTYPPPPLPLQSRFGCGLLGSSSSWPKMNEAELSS